MRAEQVADRALIAARLEGNISDAANPATRNSVWLHNVTGTAQLVDSLVTGWVHNQVDVGNTSGTMTIEVMRTPSTPPR